MKRLWVKMTQAFGHRFISGYGEKDEGVWLEGLGDLTVYDIARGFKQMLRDLENIEMGQTIWPPNVMEFRAYCLGSTKMPSAGVSFNEVKGSWYVSQLFCTHPAGYQAALWVGYDRLSQSGYAAFDDYKKVYDLLCRAVRGGLEMLPILYGVWGPDMQKKALTDFSAHRIKEAIIDLALQ